MLNNKTLAQVRREGQRASAQQVSKRVPFSLLLIVAFALACLTHQVEFIGTLEHVVSHPSENNVVMVIDDGSAKITCTKVRAARKRRRRTWTKQQPLTASFAHSCLSFVLIVASSRCWKKATRVPRRCRCMRSE